MPTSRKPAQVDAFAEAPSAPAGNDPFAKAGAAPRAAYPSFAQLGSGCDRRAVTYDEGGDNEQTRQSAGRLVMITPRKLERKVPSRYENNAPQDRWTCDVVVFDGEPITHKLDKDGDEVAEFPAPLVPVFELKGIFISASIVGKQLENHWDGTSATSKVLGRIMQLTASGDKGKPWAIGSFTPEEAAMARKWLKDNPEPDAFD